MIVVEDREREGEKVMEHTNNMMLRDQTTKKSEKNFVSALYQTNHTQGNIILFLGNHHHCILYLEFIALDTYLENPLVYNMFPDHCLCSMANGNVLSLMN